LAMRRMPGARDRRHIDRTVTFLPGDLDLAHGAVLIVLALDNGDGYADVGEVFADVPSTKVRVKPGIVPAVEGVVGIAMPARQFGPQIGCLIGPLDLGNRGDRNVF